VLDQSEQRQRTRARRHSRRSIVETFERREQPLALVVEKAFQGHALRGVRKSRILVVGHAGMLTATTATAMGRRSYRAWPSRIFHPQLLRLSHAESVGSLTITPKSSRSVTRTSSAPSWRPAACGPWYSGGDVIVTWPTAWPWRSGCVHRRGVATVGSWTRVRADATLMGLFTTNVNAKMCHIRDFVLPTPAVPVSAAIVAGPRSPGSRACSAFSRRYAQ